jgi:hypothetical protein
VDNFSKHYSRAIRYNRENWELLRQRLDQEPHHRWGGAAADHTLRAVAADAFEEATGNSAQADRLRDPNQHVILSDGGVHRGRFTVGPLQRALTLVRQRLEDWANHETPVEAFPDVTSVGPDGTVQLVRHPMPAVVRDHNGNGRFDPTPEEAAARPPTREKVHASAVGGRLADEYERLLQRDYGWNTRWQNSQYDEHLWNRHRQRTADAIAALRTTPVEEVVPDEEPK